MYISPSLFGKKNYCSKKCAYTSPKMGVRKKIGKTISCPTCNNEIYVCPSTMKLNKSGVKFCSRKCKGEAMMKGKTEYGFKNENVDKTSNQYTRIQIEKVRIKEHRYLMEQHIGRKLLESELVHHINGNKKDNRIENLQIMSVEEHSRIHKKKISIHDVGSPFV